MAMLMGAMRLDLAPKDGRVLRNYISIFSSIHKINSAIHLRLRHLDETHLHIEIEVRHGLEERHVGLKRA